MQDMLSDLRFSLRVLARHRGTTLIIVLTLGMGIAINVTQFSTFYGYVARPLPFDAPQQLVAVFESQPKQGLTWHEVSWPTLRDWREQNKTFQALSVYDRRGFHLRSEEFPERVDGAAVAADLFPMLGVDPAEGRHFTAEEDRFGGPSVVLLGESLARRLFEDGEVVLGQTLRIDGEPHEVVGIMPEGFAFPEIADLWVPLALNEAEESREDRTLGVVGRLKPEATIENAQQDLALAAEDVARRHPESHRDWSAQVRPLREIWMPEAARVASYAQVAAVIFVLLIVCANVANLILAQGTYRHRETALRSALGADRGRLIRQFLVESLLLAFLGGGLGILLTIWGVDGMRAMIPVRIPYWIQFEVNRIVLVYALGITVLTGLVVGLLPALRNTGFSLSESLKTRELNDGGANDRLRQAMVVGEFAFSMVLLVGALLMVKSFVRLQQVDVGYETASTLRMVVTPSDGRPEETRLDYLLGGIETLERLPGVVSAGVSLSLPGGLEGYDLQELIPEGRSEESWLGAVFNRTEPGFFETLSIPFESGRSFTREEVENGSRVLVISRSLADQLWPGEPALMRRVRFRESEGDQVWYSVIGVVRDVRPAYRLGGLDEVPDHQVYGPLGGYPLGYANFLVRTEGVPEALLTTARQEIQGLDAGIPVFNVQTLPEVLRQARWAPQFFSRTFSIFAVLALVVAALGAYGVTSFSVSRRRREMGLRMALGAVPGDLLRLVLRQGLAMAILGIVLGLVLALPMARSLAVVLYGIEPQDVGVFVGVAVILATAALLASLWPARVASRADPMEALRSE